MFADSNLIDNELQNMFFKTIQDENIYQRIVYIGVHSDDRVAEVFRNRACCPGGDYQKNYADIIWEEDVELNSQLAEILEHQIHTITHVAFRLMHEDWDYKNPNSALRKSYQEAVDKNLFNAKSYEDRKYGDINEFYRVVTQEYIFWVIATEWDFRSVWKIPHKEFEIVNKKDIADKLPQSHKLYEEFVAKILTPPDRKLVENILKYNPVVKPIVEVETDAKAKAKADADAKAKAKADADAKPVVKMINLSTKYSDQTLQELIDLSVSKIADRKSNIIAISYDIGKSKNIPIPDWPFYEHEVLLSKDQIENTLTEIRTFIENDQCVKDFFKTGYGDKSYIDQEINSFRVLLEKGADATTQRQVCATTRVVFNAASVTQSRADTLHIWVHEIYHGLQYDIALEPPAIDSWCDEDATKKSGWFVEGAADYFANHVYGEYIGEDGVNRILRRAMTAYAETGPGLNDGGIAVTAASALRLLVERGALKHSDIIDGTLFHKCERVSVYHDNNPDVKIAKSSWSEIQYVYGKYSFKPSVLY